MGPGVSVVAYSDYPTFYANNYYWRYNDNVLVPVALLQLRLGRPRTTCRTACARSVSPYAYARFHPGAGYARVYPNSYYNRGYGYNGGYYGGGYGYNRDYYNRNYYNRSRT